MRRAAGIVCAVVASLCAASSAAAASLYDAQAHCITTPPAGWVTAAAKPGDQFTVSAPPGDAALANDAATEIRTKDFFGYYETRLQIARLGYPGQTGLFPIVLDPALQSALPDAEGVNDTSCGAPGVDAVDVLAGVKNSETFHADLAHELFHAAQAQLAGNFDDNWWYEATATWAETRFGYQQPSPRAFSASVTDHPRVPMDAFSQAIDGADTHEYGAWTFVAWLFSRGKIDWTQMRQSFVQAAHSDASPIIDQLLGSGGSSLPDEVASYWSDHLNHPPRFGPTAKITVIHDSAATQTYTVKTAPVLGAQTFAIRPGASKQQMALIVKKLPAGVQLWIKTGNGTGDLLRIPAGETFNETFCRSGATAGSFDLPSTGEVRLAMTTTGSSAPATVQVKVITSTDPCPKVAIVVPGLEIVPLHLGMTIAEADAAVPRHAKPFGTLPTPFGAWQSAPFNVDGALVVAEFLDGRIAALIGFGPHVRTTTGISGYAAQFPRYAPGTDDYDRPLLIPGGKLGQFGMQHCAPLKDNGNDVRSEYCWHQGPPTRYTLAMASLADPCPTDGGPNDDDSDPVDSDEPVCSYPKDWYISGLAVATTKGFHLLQMGSAMLHG